MTPELIHAVEQWNTASAEIKRCSREYGCDTDDPAGVQAWNAALEALQRAERLIVSEALIAYAHEVKS